MNRINLEVGGASYSQGLAGCFVVFSLSCSVGYT